jgi:hypothetical protein
MFRGINLPKPEADHLPSYNAEVKKWWGYASTLPYVFMVWLLIN